MAKRKIGGVRVSRADAHRHEFHRSLKDLSTADLQYRYTENLKKIVLVEGAIKEFAAKLAAGRAEAVVLGYDHDVLTAMLEARR